MCQMSAGSFSRSRPQPSSSGRAENMFLHSWVKGFIPIRATSVPVVVFICRRLQQIYGFWKLSSKIRFWMKICQSSQATSAANIYQIFTLGARNLLNFSSRIRKKHFWGFLQYLECSRNSTIYSVDAQTQKPKITDRSIFGVNAVYCTAARTPQILQKTPKMLFPDSAWKI